jgi:hypothetical protein
MSYHEKLAWFNLAVIGLAVLTFLALIPVFGAKPASGAFGFLGLLGFSPLLFKPRATSLQTLSDERDRAIQAKAVVIAYSIFWVVFVGGSMGVWALYQDRGSIPVDILPMFPLVGWMLLTSVQAVATLIQYARGK